MSDAMITYERVEGKRELRVRIEGTLVGRIKPAHEGGWFYAPLGNSRGGKLYPTIEQVKRSLETDDSEDE